MIIDNKERVRFVKVETPQTSRRFFKRGKRTLPPAKWHWARTATHGNGDGRRPYYLKRFRPVAQWRNMELPPPQFGDRSNLISFIARWNKNIVLSIMPRDSRLGFDAHPGTVKPRASDWDWPGIRPRLLLNRLLSSRKRPCRFRSFEHE